MDSFTYALVLSPALSEIIGLSAGAVYGPTAIITLAKKAGMSGAQVSKAASIGTAILSIGTILECLKGGYDH
jgi:hypothetical protein